MIDRYCFRLLNVKCEKNIGLCERIDNRSADLKRIPVVWWCGELGEARVSFYQYMTLFESHSAGGIWRLGGCALVQAWREWSKTWCKSVHLTWNQFLGSLQVLKNSGSNFDLYVNKLTLGIFFKVWWQDVTLFVYFSYFYNIHTFIQSHSYNPFIHRHSLRPLS
jgi:hypothetical protein